MSLGSKSTSLRFGISMKGIFTARIPVHPSLEGHSLCAKIYLWPPKQAVRIVLECILVCNEFSHVAHITQLQRLPLTKPPLSCDNLTVIDGYNGTVSSCFPNGAGRDDSK